MKWKQPHDGENGLFKGAWKTFANWIRPYEETSKDLLKQSFLKQLPSRIEVFIFGENDSRLEDLRSQLETFLRAAALRRDVVNAKVFSEFLQLDKHSPQLLAFRPRMLWEVEMSERVNDSGKVLLDCYVGDNFVVLASGNDSPLQRLNSFVANSRFPWEDDEELDYVLPLGTVEYWARRGEGAYHRIWARNYPVQTRSLLFAPTALAMAVGLSDGTLQLFRLLHKPNYIYYEVLKLLQLHQDTVSWLHLDELTSLLFSASPDGWINVVDASRAIPIDQLQLPCQISSFKGDPRNPRLFVATVNSEIQIFQYNTFGKLRCLHVLPLHQESIASSLFLDSDRNYLFAVANKGTVTIYELGARGHQAVSQRIGVLQGRDNLVDVSWDSQRMELLLASSTGQISFWDTLHMLKAFDTLPLSRIALIPGQRCLFIIARGRAFKMWQLPTAWRDAKDEHQEDCQIDIRRKVNNLHRTQQALRRKMNDSQDDDLRGWHWSDSDQDN